uniref:CCHC-type domain-containing protein n=1 Tax=Brassica oleracea var. oleracea TaxID=109376 RepID=A0A0D3E4H9_BRAOL
MRKSFIPYNFERLLFQKFHNIRQGSRSVEDYANEFYQMLTRVDIHDSEDQLVARFIAGLQPQLQNMLHQFDLCSVSEARQRALLVEQQTRLSANQWSGNSKSRNTTTAEDTKSVNTQTATTSSGSKTTYHTDEQTDARPARPNALRCFTCGEQGHIQTACPNRGRRGLLATDKEFIGDTIYDEDEEQFDDMEEEQVAGDTALLARSKEKYAASLLIQDVQRTWFQRKRYANSLSNRRLTHTLTDSFGCKPEPRYMSLNAPWFLFRSEPSTKMSFTVISPPWMCLTLF